MSVTIDPDLFEKIEKISKQEKISTGKGCSIPRVFVTYSFSTPITLPSLSFSRLCHSQLLHKYIHRLDYQTRYPLYLSPYGNE